MSEARDALWQQIRMWMTHVPNNNDSANFPDCLFELDLLWNRLGALEVTNLETGVLK